mgnify:FL=1
MRRKQCKEEGCTFLVWSKGKCKKHTHSSNGGYSLADIFNEHWDNHPTKQCEACNKQLYGENKTYYHDHLLDKSKHPQLALDMDNLFLCCMDCHSAKTSGFPRPKHKEAIEQALILCKL